MIINGISDKILINGDIIEILTWPYEFEFKDNIVYEVIRIIDGKPLFLKEHIERMENSLKLMGAPIERVNKKVYDALKKFLFNSNLKNNNLKILIGNIFDGSFDIVIFYIKSFYPDQTIYKKGVDVSTFLFTRTNPNAKILNEKMTQEVNKIRDETNVFEVLLVNDDGIVTEGSRSNVFFVKGNDIVLSNSSKILNGITMKKVVETMKDLNLNLIEKDVFEKEIETFDGCFMTGTSNNILPIRKINDVLFSSSENEIILKLIDKFNKKIKEDLELCQI